MTASTPDLETCPAQFEDCNWLSELSALRKDNDELKLLVTTDTLTDLYNYRFFRDMLSKEMDRSVRTGRPTSLIMIDLDYFKNVNDEWGHEGGNQALIKAATIFKQAIRLSDVVCRYGGEEFVIILPQTALPTAVNIAERVRLWLEQATVEFEEETFKITASFGVGTFLEPNEYTLESFVDSVDQYLYQAKENGRNQVGHADYSTLKRETSVSAEEKSALFGNDDD